MTARHRTNPPVLLYETSTTPLLDDSDMLSAAVIDTSSVSDARWQWWQTDTTRAHKNYGDLICAQTHTLGVRMLYIIKYVRQLVLWVMWPAGFGWCHLISHIN